MPARHVVIDGSNLATEGRSMPSLAQLDQAVREFIAENPNDVVTVVVDASFGHRIDPSELPTFEGAEEAGEIISPPAGAIGRGDAFLLRIAEKTGATVLSNDSFQEFHGDHVWLFDKGRLIGGKPVPGVGWIFMERSPVRGHKSREVVKEAKRRKKAVDGPELVEAAPKPRGRPKSVDRAIARATQEVVEPKTGSGGRRRRSGRPASDPVNEPLTFITFIAAHPLGTEVIGSVAEYSSHGAVVMADGARCYIPLSAMADPPPRKAREVVGKGESRPFVVQAFDPLRRGIELAIPGFAAIAAEPTPETVEAEIHQEAVEPRRRTRKPKKVEEPVAEPAAPGVAAGPAKKRAAKKSPGPATADAIEAPAPDKAAAGRKKAPAKTAPAKKAAATKAPAKKAAVTKKAPATTKAAVTKKAAATTKAVSTRKAAAATKALPAKTAAVKKTAVKKVAAKTSATKKPAAATSSSPARTTRRRTGTA